MAAHYNNIPPFGQSCGALGRFVAVPSELLRSSAEDTVGMEHRAITDALEMQRQVGIEVYTNGDMHRDAWMPDLPDAVDGFVDDHHIIRWHKPGGNTEGKVSRLASITGAVTATFKV